MFQHDAIGVVTMAALAFVPMSAHVRMVILDTTAEREVGNKLKVKIITLIYPSHFKDMLVLFACCSSCIVNCMETGF